MMRAPRRRRRVRGERQKYGTNDNETGRNDARRAKSDDFGRPVLPALESFHSTPQFPDRPRGDAVPARLPAASLGKSWVAVHVRTVNADEVRTGLREPRVIAGPNPPR
jgi:hypothetical protein